MRHLFKNTIIYFFFLIFLGSCWSEDSFNGPSKAPLYWSVYEYCYLASNNQNTADYIPESELKKNIDWMNDNLKLYGYNMVCMDGWGDDSQFNEHGYRTTHSRYWEHDYAWWSAYLQERGMTLGMYNNPLWVIKTAADAGVKIKGTDIPLSTLINDEGAKWFNWVQVSQPGAEEYVKGYVQYYADMGVSYLRVDFLSWFEDGIDRNPDFSAPLQRTEKEYQLALKWIKEACDANGIILSLVMPHLYEHAKNELAFAGGSLIRINDDVCDGGWERLSELNRNRQHTIWPTYHNSFDGFIHWSDIAGFGKGKLILDGDFTRMNSFANDDEKKTAISIQLMTGGPIAIADQYSTIGDDLWLYQNEEILALNRDGFVGQPLSQRTTSPESQVWYGRMSDGDYIIGLFNREDFPQIRTLNFSETLGIDEGHIRDLWEHKELGIMTAITDTLAPHACRIYRVQN